MMFTCPDKEIHSVYLDGELPSKLVAGYEAHIAVCEKCRASLQRLKAVHEIIALDAASITPDRVFAEQSWERLKARRRYSDVMRKSRPAAFDAFSSGKVAGGLRRMLPAVAAAAVVAVVLPMRMRQSSSIQSETQAAVQGNSGSILLTGAQAGLPPIAPSFTNTVNGAFNQSHNISYGPNIDFSSKSGRAGIDRPHVFGNKAVAIAPVDVFRPNFGEEEGKTINIRISVPSIDGERAYTTIRVPMDVIKAAEE